MQSTGHQSLACSHSPGGLDGLFSTAALLHCDLHKSVTLSLFFM